MLFSAASIDLAAALHRPSFASSLLLLSPSRSHFLFFGRGLVARHLSSNVGL
jgi:hypothetical protein